MCTAPKPPDPPAPPPETPTYFDASQSKGNTDKRKRAAAGGTLLTGKGVGSANTGKVLLGG